MSRKTIAATIEVCPESLPADVTALEQLARHLTVASTVPAHRIDQSALPPDAAGAVHRAWLILRQLRVVVGPIVDECFADQEDGDCDTELADAEDLEASG